MNKTTLTIGGVAGSAFTIALLLSLGATPGNYLLTKRAHVQLTQTQASADLDGFCIKHFGVNASALARMQCVAGPASIGDDTPVLRCSATFVVEKTQEQALSDLEIAGAVKKVPEK